MWQKTHERDQRITFDAEKHIYYIDNIECSLSVTGLVHSFFPKFDPIATIDQYYDRWQRYRHPKYYGLSKEDIIQQWIDTGDEGSALGTQLHEAIETFYKGGTPNIVGIEEDYAHFVAFQKKYSHLVPYRIEWRVSTEPDIGIAGTIDMCFTSTLDPDNRIFIADWKRTKKDVVMTGFKDQTGLPPLDHIPDTNFYHYSLQLNTYKYILEKYYDLTISGMGFIVLHRNRPTYQIYKLGDYQKEVQQMFDIVKAKRQQGLMM